MEDNIKTCLANPIFEEETAIHWDLQCFVKGCMKGDAPLKCSVYACTNSIHKTCAFALHKLFLGSIKKQLPMSVQFNDTDIVCSKRCFNKLLKKKSEIPKPPTTRFWGNDGPNKFISSMSVLMDWLTTANNYSKWRGGDKHSGTTKKTLASVIAGLI